MSLHNDVRELVGRTLFVDTHEHLLEESSRIASAADGERCDIGVLFSHYADSDLVSSGMSPEDQKKVVGPGLSPRDKWRILEPYYKKTRNSGYLRNVRESVRMLYGEDDLREDNVESISEKIATAIKPGYYGPILKDVSGIEYAQVNSLETPLMLFSETEQPELLTQDIGFNSLSSSVNHQQALELSEMSGVEVATLPDFHRVQDWVFETFGPRAIAVKNQGAYGRRLDYEQVSAEDAAPLFSRMMSGEELNSADHKAVADHLFHRCIDKAVEYNLPVKLHTGYYAGNWGMPLHRVGANPGDICELLRAHKDATFVLMHMSWPYQDELIAICKHYPNAHADLCWAWIANPLGVVQFTKEYLSAAPASKLLTFGGDYMPIELVPGHASIARQGLSQAVTELVMEGWVEEPDVEDLVESLMRGNAHDIFDYEGTLSNWS
jgi:uncharacterized protein